MLCINSAVYLSGRASHVRKDGVIWLRKAVALLCINSTFYLCGPRVARSAKMVSFRVHPSPPYSSSTYAILRKVQHRWYGRFAGAIEHGILDAAFDRSAAIF